MRSKYANQTSIVKAARQSFLAAKENLLNSGDSTSDEAAALLDALISARNAFITQSIVLAELSPKCTTEYRAALRTLAERAEKSPAVRERLIERLLAIELK